MIDHRPRIFKTTLVACMVALIVVMLGSWTRLKDSGLGCPDWPGCYGYFDVRKAIEHVDSINKAKPNTFRDAQKTIPEMVHRYFASTLGLLIIIIATLSILNRKQANQPVALPVFLVFLVIFQGILGMLTVTEGLYPPTVTGHLLGGFTTLTLLFLLALHTGNKIPDIYEPSIAKFKPAVLLCLIVLLLQIMLGGWTAANYAAAVCTDLPICEGAWQEKLNFAEAFRLSGFEHIHDFEFGVLDHDARTTIHVFHRIGAIITSVIIFVLAITLIANTTSQYYKRAGIILLALLVLQVILGIINVLFNIPLYIAVAHNAGGALLLICLATIFYSIMVHSSKSLHGEMAQ